MCGWKTYVNCNTVAMTGIRRSFSLPLLLSMYLITTFLRYCLLSNNIRESE